jgi:hypothetical protein
VIPTRAPWGRLGVSARSSGYRRPVPGTGEWLSGGRNGSGLKGVGALVNLEFFVAIAFCDVKQENWWRGLGKMVDAPGNISESFDGYWIRNLCFDKLRNAHHKLSRKFIDCNNGGCAGKGLNTSLTIYWSNELNEVL